MGRGILIGLTIGLAVRMGGCYLGLPSSAPVIPSQTQAMPKPEIVYQTHSLPRAIAYSLQIPGQGFEVVPAMAEGTREVGDFARQYQAIAAINAGFFDPANQKTTSYGVLNGNLVADPGLNDRLMNNPDLTPYMDKILNRSEFRRYRCEETFRYAIARHRDPIPANCQLADAIGGGPQLLPENTSIQEGFVDFVEGMVIRDAIGVHQPNARSAVGITSDGSILLVMVAQQPTDSAPSGISLPDLAALMKRLGAQQAMNLDGGTSSALHFRGTTFYGKLDDTGNPVGRPVKSVLLVQDKRQ